jgi:phosphomannomutase/phosphoglucomutase
MNKFSRQNPSSHKPSQRLTHWPSVLLVVLPSLAVIALYFFIYLPLTVNQAASQRANDLAHAKVVALNSNLKQLADHMDGLARLPEIHLAIQAHDKTALQQLAEQFALGFTDVSRLALFPLGELGVASLGHFKTQVHNNIEKDLLRRALAADQATARNGVEVDTYLINGQQVLSLARPIQFEGRNIGAILLTLKAQWLASQFVESAASNEHSAVMALIYQMDAKTPILLATTNPLPLTKSAVLGVAPLAANAKIKVNYYVFKSATVFGVESILLLVVLLSAMILSLTALLFLFRSMRSQAVATGEVDLNSKQPVGSAPKETATKRVDSNNSDSNNDTNNSDTNNPDSSKASRWVNPQVPNVMEVEGDEGSLESSTIPMHIFRAYDIRGNAATELDDETVQRIGLAIGTMAMRGGQHHLVIGRDGRLSSERIYDALTKGLLASGCDVIGVGLVATPMVYFACESLETKAGVMVTGSHNGPEVNGLKVVLNGQSLADQQIQGLLKLIVSNDFEQGEGVLSEQAITDAYIDRITEDVVVASSMKVVLDCCNGAASLIAPRLFSALGCEVVPLFAEVDGSFPSHAPDPSAQGSLDALINEVSHQQADLGIAFDGDADRMVAVTAMGKVVSADQMLMLFAKDVLTRNPGADIVYDIKCSRHLNQLIASHGGRPVMSKCGHSLIKQKMIETGALLGGEFTGHYCFKERWFGFDDGLYSGGRLIELLTMEGARLDEVIAELPVSMNTAEVHLPVDERRKFEIVDALQQALEQDLSADDGQITLLDGVRVDYAAGWGLVRASNTSANLNLRFEADNEEALNSIQARFREGLEAVAPELKW